MPCRKGVGRFSSSEDNDNDSDSSEEVVLREDIISIRHRQNNWVDTNYDALTESYRQFRLVGEKLFGFAFFQLGSFREYCDLCYKFTIVGSAVGVP